MTEDSQTGPWVLAIGALALGVGAVAVELLRSRRDCPAADGRAGERNRHDGP